MSDQELKIGTVGTGVIVEGFIDAVRRNNKSSIQAAYIRPNSKNLGFAEKLKIPTVYHSYEEMLQDEEINFIYVASPNSLHFPMTKEALNAGKNVICEKPFTSTKVEADELKQLTEKKGLYLFEAISILHMPNYKALKDKLNELGSISLVQANYSQFSSKYNQLIAGEVPNVFNLEYSGGSLMDINIYNLHAVVDIFGLPKESIYYANKFDNGVDTSGTAILLYDHFISNITGAKDSRSKNYFQIQGTKGFVNVVDGINGVSRVEVSINNVEDMIDLQEESNRLFYEVEAFEEIFVNKKREDHLKLLEHSCEVMGVLDQLRRSADIRFGVEN